MFVRIRWFMLGASAGAVGTVKVLRTVRSILPARFGPQDLADAWREGRAAMAEREEELRERYGLAKPIPPGLPAPTHIAASARKARTDHGDISGGRGRSRPRAGIAGGVGRSAVR